MFTLRVTLEVNMALGQNHGFATIRPGALPQATVLDGLRPNWNSNLERLKIEFRNTF